MQIQEKICDFFELAKSNKATIGLKPCTLCGVGPGAGNRNL